MIPIIVPRKVEKPWGWELWVAVTEKYAGKIIHINPGQKLSRQYHIIKDETVYVISGRLVVEIGQAGTGHQTDVTAADDADLHGWTSRG